MDHLPPRVVRTDRDLFRFRGQSDHAEALAAAGLVPSDEIVAVATATSVGEVVDAVVRSRSMGLALRSVPFVPASDGTDAGGALFVDVRPPLSLRIDPVARSVRLRPGARWRQVLDAARPFGLAPLAPADPLGDPVAFVLGAGIGTLGRRHGLAANAVQSVTVVLANGEVVLASPHTEPDLFWALRGGGAGFGIVTELQMRLVSVHDVHRLRLTWHTDEVDAVVAAWTAWCEGADWSATSVLRVAPSTDPGGTPTVTVDLAVLQDELTGAALAQRVEDGFRTHVSAAAPPARIERDTQVDGHGTVGPAAPALGGTAEPVDLADARAVGRRVATATARGLPVEVRQLGGALAIPPEDGGAVDRLDGDFLVRTPSTATDGGRRWVVFDDVREQRLLRIRAQVDPKGRLARDADARRSALVRGPAV